jgi:acetyltransferase
VSTPPDIARLFAPRGVAVIGASRDPRKIGYKIVENIIHGGSSAAIYPVNPQGGELLGLRVHRRVSEIDSAVDLACIAIPAPHVPAALEDCARAGVSFVAIISSGFSEVGETAAEQHLVRLAREHGMRILGPNIFGLFTSHASLNAGFGPREIRSGRVAIITQSGAMGGAMIGKTAAENIGLSAIIPLGNKADIDEADLLAFLREDPRTEIILIYIEGVKDGRRLIQALAATTPHKPVIVIKTGRSRRGALAAASHTGSLAGADEVFDDLMRQCGVLRAEQLQEALAWCKFLGEAPVPAGESAVIVTNGGGAGVAASDACEKYEVALSDDLATLERVFAPVTPPLGSTKNPIDFTGQATSADYRRALLAALDEPSCHALIAVYCETALLGFDRLPEDIAEIYARYQEAGKPIVFCLLGGEQVRDALARLRRTGVPAFDEIYTAVSCLGAMYAHHRHRGVSPGPVVSRRIDREAAKRIVTDARAEQRKFLLADESQALLAALGLCAPRSRIARSIGEAVASAEAIGFPVALKIVSRDIVHKSDAGGVALDLEDRQEVIEAYEAVLQSCRRYNPAAHLQGVEIVEMAPRGAEIIIGARRDPAFGPIAMVGLGGIYVELLGDVAFRAAPLRHADALAMIKETRAHQLLLGVRGEERRDVAAVVDTLITLGVLIDAVPGIADIEVNPLVVLADGEGAVAVDVRVALAD